jgi:hypothetical protein
MKQMDVSDEMTINRWEWRKKAAPSLIKLEQEVEVVQINNEIISLILTSRVVSTTEQKNSTSPFLPWMS